MSEAEKYVERVKDKLLYEIKEGGDVTAMLSFSDTNKKTTDGLARWAAFTIGLCNCLKGKYCGFLNDDVVRVHREFFSINGEPREQAIRMRAELARFEQEKNRGGILGLFGK